MIAFKDNLGAGEYSVLARGGWLEFRRGKSLIYDIQLKDFRNPSVAADWWRQLTGKTWFTPGLSKRVEEAVESFLHLP
jgi:hypothetical protein